MTSWMGFIRETGIENGRWNGSWRHVRMDSCMTRENWRDGEIVRGIGGMVELENGGMMSGWGGGLPPITGIIYCVPETSVCCKPFGDNNSNAKPTHL